MSAAAVAAGAMAVESQNIVGFAPKATPNGVFTWTCPTFAPAGTNETFKLGDLKGNDAFEAFGDTITFATADGNWEDSITYVSQAWLNANDLGEEGYTVGWYALTDDEMTTPLNDTLVPFAKGFAAQAGRDNVDLIFAGEVIQTRREVPLGNGEFTWMGNACLDATTLGEIKGNNVFEAFGDTVTFATADGNWEDSITYVSQAWLNANDLGEEGYTVGWYVLADDEMKTPLNDTPVASGQAFAAQAVREGVTISIPATSVN